MSQLSGLAIDKPLDIIHMDNMSGGAGTILPIATWRGSFVQATDPQGNLLCPPPGNSAAPCIVTFPGSYSSTFYNAGLPVERVSWFGSLAEGNVDGSGTIYMRNRYYNPQTGSFTQQDPIGLAGGLNTYGFANGDPVSYSDPYGLCPVPPTNCADAAMAVYTVGKFLVAPSLGTGVDAALDLAGALPGVPSVGVLRRVVGAADEGAAVIKVSRSRFPEAAGHIDDAQGAGHPAELTIDRAGAAARRRQAVSGMPGEAEQTVMSTRRQ